jgi:hypothetical protein
MHKSLLVCLVAAGVVAVGGTALARPAAATVAFDCGEPCTDEEGGAGCTLLRDDCDPSTGVRTCTWRCG